MYLLNVLLVLWASALVSSIAWALLTADLIWIRRLTNIVPPFVIFSYGAVAYFLPKPSGGNVPTPMVLAMHYGAIALLFAFLVIAVSCQRKIWALQRNPKAKLTDFNGPLTVWWGATRLLPAPAALGILISGLRMVYEDAAKGDIARWWDFTLFSFFGLMFIDGLAGYFCEILFQYEALQYARGNNLSTADYLKKYRSCSSEVILFLHALSFPFVFAIGATQPDTWMAPLGVVNYLNALAGHFTTNPDRLRVLAAFFLVLAIGVVVLLVRLPGLIRRIIAIRQFTRAAGRSAGQPSPAVV